MLNKRTESRSARSRFSGDTDGQTAFSLEGTVQNVRTYEKIKADYVEFSIKQPSWKDSRKHWEDNITIIVPFSLNIALEKGNRVVIDGTIHAHWDEKVGRNFIDLIAEDIRESE